MDDRARTSLVRASVGQLGSYWYDPSRDVPDSVSESALKGLSFYTNSADAELAAAGLWKTRTCGWALETIVAAGVFIGYIISRAIGIFGLPPDAWLEPLDIASLTFEGPLAALVLKVIPARRTALYPARAR